MSDTPEVSTGPSATPSTGLLAKERTVAAADFNRWLVPPAALCIHLCIGMAYGFSVFWLPLSRAIGIDKSVACPAGTSWVGELFASGCDWSVSMLSVTFTLFIVVLGLSAALWGGWLERVGPRKAGVVAALCWGGGFLLGALGIYVHQLWLIWLGTGILGGIGLGIGYISPVSTLIKWFPDRRGMATGMAIMGFGGGAMIGSPLADLLMRHFATPASVGVWQTFLVMGVVYLVVMLIGAFGYRVPPPGWKPGGWTATDASAKSAMITRGHVHLEQAWKTPQFWLIWAALCLNVSAGIGVLAMASPMLQEVFGGKLIGLDLGFGALSPDQRKQIATIAAGFTGLLSLFNILGRFGWASLSDYIGRKNTYFVFFILGMILYASAPGLGHAGHVALFVVAFCVILSMYGGGFSTVPAYLADMFGTQMVGAIHGRLLTAWSAAGVIGPVLINYFRDSQLAAGVPRNTVYDATMYVLTGLLALGFVCNLLVRPVAARWFLTEDELAAERGRAHDVAASSRAGLRLAASGSSGGFIYAAWLGVGVPILWGVWLTLQKVMVLFH
ncbi:MAG TPA: OFA family MFS transporter [Rhodanobacteraceae bacterium]|nr:OFA family MFS transporter [Rhodanobacteraceae bacterium]